jgi:hypothetical protein
MSHKYQIKSKTLPITQAKTGIKGKTAIKAKTLAIRVTTLYIWAKTAEFG